MYFIFQNYAQFLQAPFYVSLKYTTCKLFSYPRVRNLTTHLTLKRTLTSSTQFMLSTRQTRLSSHFLSTSSNLVGTDKFIIQTNYPCTAVEFRKDKIIHFHTDVQVGARPQRRIKLWTSAIFRRTTVRRNILLIFQPIIRYISV